MRSRTRIAAMGLSMALIAMASAALAEPRQLTAPEITALISGRTVEGTWNGTPYTQIFDPTGWTLYEAEGAPPDRGKWRVNSETNQYESWWERGGWSAYAVLEEAGAYFWQSARGDPQPFRVLPES